MIGSRTAYKYRRDTQHYTERAGRALERFRFLFWKCTYVRNFTSFINLRYSGFIGYMPWLYRSLFIASWLLSMCMSWLCDLVLPQDNRPNTTTKATTTQRTQKEKWNVMWKGGSFGGKRHFETFSQSLYLQVVWAACFNFKRNYQLNAASTVSHSKSHVGM